MHPFKAIRTALVTAQVSILRWLRGVALLAVVAGSCALLLAPEIGQKNEARYDYDETPDLERVPVNPEWTRTLLTQPRDTTGVAGSNVGSKVHGGTGTRKKPQYASRMFRTGYPGIEPTLGITSNGWIFYVALDPAPPTGFASSVVLSSKDGGATWQAASPSRATADPYLWVDPATDRIFWSDYTAAGDFGLAGGCGLLAYSSDFGETWHDTTPVGCGYNTDHQTIYAGPPVTSALATYKNVVYYCSIGGGTGNNWSTMTVCSKSLDGGDTFVPTGSPAFPVTPVDQFQQGLPGPCGGGSGHVFVAGDGTVYVPRGVCGQPWLAISRDEGNTWSRIQVANNGMGRNIGGHFDHEAAVRADSAGTVYYTWVARDRLPYLAVSRDHGQTWGAPIPVAPPEVNETNLPSLDLDESGRLAFAYMATTQSPMPHFLNDQECHAKGQIIEGKCPQGTFDAAASGYANTGWTAYITLTEDPLSAAPSFESTALSTLEEPLVIGECGPGLCQAEKDFIDVEFGPDGEVFAAVIDGCGPAGCATGSGEYGEAVVGTLVDAKDQPTKPDPSPDPGIETFVPDGTLAYVFAPAADAVGAGLSPEGCGVDNNHSTTSAAGAHPIGVLAAPGTSSPCRTAVAFVSSHFESAPLEAPIVVAGPVRFTVYLTSPEVEDAVFLKRVALTVSDVAPEASPAELARFEGVIPVREGRNEFTLPLAPAQIPDGHRLRVSISVAAHTGSFAYHPSSRRTLYGGSQYGDAGVSLTFGHFETPEPTKQTGASPKSEDGPQPESSGLVASAGALSLPLLLLGVLAAARRRLRR